MLSRNTTGGLRTISQNQIMTSLCHCWSLNWSQYTALHGFGCARGPRALATTATATRVRRGDRHADCFSFCSTAAAHVTQSNHDCCAVEARGPSSSVIIVPAVRRPQIAQRLRCEARDISPQTSSLPNPSAMSVRSFRHAGASRLTAASQWDLREKQRGQRNTLPRTSGPLHLSPFVQTSAHSRPLGVQRSPAALQNRSRSLQERHALRPHIGPGSGKRM